MPNWIPFLTFICIGAFTPGPNNCMALSHATRGMRHGLIFSLGVFGGMLVTMLACGLLSSFLTQHLGTAEVVMKTLGCVYMIWLAWSLWQASGFADGPVQSPKNLLATGCALQLVNPKLITYGLTSFSVFLLPYYQAPSTLAGFAVFLALVSFAGTLAWALCGAALQNLFRRHPVVINRVLAVMVLGCVISLLA